MSRYVFYFTILFFSFSSTANVGGVDHVGLSVVKLNESEDFFVRHAGFRLLGRDEDYPSSFLTNDDVMITLWRVSSTQKFVEFDRKNNIGLHHLALKVDSLESLEAIHRSIANDPSAKVEFSPEPVGNGPSVHMMVYEPSGNRIEFVFRPGN